MASLVATPGASAQASTSRRRLPLRLVVEACALVPAAEVRRIVAIELRGRLADAVTPDEDTTRASVTCESAVEITVDDPITGKTLLRTIALTDRDPEVRARVLALAIVELVSASWAELVTNPEPRVVPQRVAPPEPEVVETAAEVARELEDRPFQVGGYVSLRARAGFFPTQRLAVAGPGVRVALRVLERLTLTADLAFDFGRREGDAAEVRTERYGGALGLLYDVWGERLGAFVGGGLVGARARLRGRSDVVGAETSSRAGAFAALALEAGLRVRAGAFFLNVSSSLALPLAHPVGAVVDQGAATRTEVAPSGLELALALGVGFTL
ncbi:MAG: hypothetical protein AAGH15_20840 [Myxococcota bacterium]